MKNTIYTIEEYMAQGFTKSEAYAKRKFDKMHNNYNNLSEKEKEKYFAIVKRLGL